MPTADPTPPKTPSAETRPEDRVPLREKIALGCGGLTDFMGGAGVPSISIPFYQMTLGIDPALLGAVFALQRLWDAFTDLIIGNLSDNFHSRWGRRKPFLVIGAILMGITFGLIWMVPQGISEGWQLTYFVAFSFLFYGCSTIFTVPYRGLSYELTADYNERTRVMAYPMFFSKIGEACYSWFIPLATLFASFVIGIRFVGWGIGLIFMLGFGILPGLFVRERFKRKTEHQRRVPLFRSLGDALRMNAFRVLIYLTILNLIAGIFVSSLDQYLLVYYVEGGDKAAGFIWKGWLSSGYAVVGMVGIPIVAWISNRIGKRMAMRMVYGMVAVGGIMKFFLFVPGAGFWILLDPLLCGPVWIGIGMLIPSMLADICDEDELNHGQRREAMFSSIYTWIQKFGVSIALLTGGIALKLSGFDEQLGGDQAPETILAMRFIFSGFPAVSSVLALLTLGFYPITRARADQTREALEARRGVAKV